ncbi:MAG: type 1 glutamine amidotransferase [Microcella sp.]|uniref:type 1 glutamine amidotransferase n=1 Tax=Microcella sp. TaxID=1913979 RepID=UPI0024CA2FC8|nr:type 1 glutamine amidotransferase [Microcella sp.]UYN83878.1 MAG: type 1 glutamine amidotransferase [Microcella sp.]
MNRARPDTMAPEVLVVLHDVDDNLGELAPPFAEAGLRIVMWDVARDPDGAPPLETLDRFSAIVSLGAYAGVTDESSHPWMTHERRMLESALDADLPVLGLCFGSQLLAAAAGAPFRPSPVPELGWTRARLTAAASADALMAPLATAGDEIDVFHYHFDSHDLPEGAVLLAETDGIIEAYRVGDSAWGLQFHLEVGLATQLAWIAGARHVFAREGLDPAAHEQLSHEHWKAYRDHTHAVGAAFAEQVLQRHAQR